MKQQKTNGLAVAGLITAFFIPLIGFILSIIGLNKSKETNNGKGLAIAGIIISIFVGIGQIILVVGMLGVVNEVASNTSTSITNQEPASSQTQEEDKPEEQSRPETKESDVPAEYTSALNQATSYSSTMHMSKQGVYDQLVSEYGGQFSAAAAKYAIDNVKADWNANALAQAKNYQDTMNMSPAAIHDQLVSEYGGQFTKTEADYAIDNL